MTSPFSSRIALGVSASSILLSCALMLSAQEQIPGQRDFSEATVSASQFASALLPQTSRAQPPVEVIAVAKDVFAIRRAYVGSNAAAIITERGVIIVDSHATPAAARHTLAALQRITTKPITTVINTHWHTDHSAGNSAYAEAYGPGVNIISHHTVREDLPKLGVQQMARTAQFVQSALEKARAQLDDAPSSLSAAERKDLESYVRDESSTLEALKDLEFVLPTMTFERSLTLHGMDFPIHILYFGPGHTRGDVVVYLPNQKTVITGDLLTSPQLYVGQSSRPSKWVASLRALGKLDFDRVIPGHGEVFEGKEYLEMATLMLDAVVTTVLYGIARNSKYEEIVRTTSLDGVRKRYLSEYPTRGEAFDRAAAFLEDAVGITYREATRNLRN